MSTRTSSLLGYRFKLGLVFSSVTWLLAGCGSSTEVRPASWSFISASIIQPSCATANCHSNISMRSGVALDTIRDGWDQLVNRHFVIPGDVADSALPALLRAEGTQRMPPDGALPDIDITLIESWISLGAKWDGPGAAPGLGAVDAGNSGS